MRVVRRRASWKICCADGCDNRSRSWNSRCCPPCQDPKEANQQQAQAPAEPEVVYVQAPAEQQQLLPLQERSKFPVDAAFPAAQCWRPFG